MPWPTPSPPWDTARRTGRAVRLADRHRRWERCRGRALYRRYWAEGTSKVHVIGKGILRFHAVYWPAMLLSAAEPLPDTIFVHGYLTVGGQKLSKSLGNGVDPALVERYGADAVRYWLLRDVPPSADADYTAERLEGRYTADLANDLGNLLQRTVSMVQRFRQGEIPALPALPRGGGGRRRRHRGGRAPARGPGPLRPPERPGGAVRRGGAGQPLRRGDGALDAGPPPEPGEAGLVSISTGCWSPWWEALRVVGEGPPPLPPRTRPAPSRPSWARRRPPAGRRGCAGGRGRGRPPRAGCRRPAPLWRLAGTCSTRALS